MIRKILFTFALLLCVVPLHAQEVTTCSPLPVAGGLETVLDCPGADQNLCRMFESLGGRISRKVIEARCEEFDACAAAENFFEDVISRTFNGKGNNATAGPCVDCGDCMAGSGCCCEGQCDCLHLWYCNGVTTTVCNTVDSGWCPGGYTIYWLGQPCFWQYQCCN